MILTIREVLDALDEPGELDAATTFFALLRTVVQGGRDTATDEGITASIIKFRETYGEEPTKDNIAKRFPTLMDLEVPVEEVKRVLAYD